MATPDPALGFSFNIDSDVVRNALRFAMEVGAPPDDDLKATFVFEPGARTYTKNNVPVANPRMDRDGVPLDPEIEIHEADALSVQVDCAVEINHATPDELPVGKYRATRATVTLLDEEYAQVTGCKELHFNGDRYEYDSEQYGLGLGDIGVHILHFYGIDES